MKSLKRILRRSTQQRLPSQLVIHEQEKVYSNMQQQERKLPIELLLRVFEYLSPQELINSRSVCQWFKEVIDGAPEVQYRIELYVYGYVHNDACTDIGVSQRLEALRAQTHFWKNPQFSWVPQDVPWSHGDLRYNHFHENLWVRSLNIGWTEHPWKFNAVQCVVLEPGRNGSAVLDTWKLQFPFAFDCYITYPSRGYIMLLDSILVGDPQCYIIRKVSLDSGQLLSEDMVPLGGPPLERWAGPVMDAAGGNAISIIRSALLPDTNQALLRVTLLDFPAMQVTVDTSIVVQDDSLIAVQLVEDDCLILHIMRGGKFETQVYTVKHQAPPDEDKLGLYLVTIFHFPEVQQDWVSPMTDMNFIVGGSGGGLVSRNVPPRPFVRQVEDPPLLVLRWYQRPDGTQSRVIHVVPLSVFTSVTHTFVPSRTPSEQTTHTQWEDWGPKKTRCFLDHRSFLPGNYTYQILFSDFTLLDFNQLDIARDLQRAAMTSSVSLDVKRKRRASIMQALRTASLSALRSKGVVEDIEIPGYSGGIVLQPNTIPKGEMFAQDVTTCLPYRRTKLEWTGPEPVFVYVGEVLVVCSKEVQDDGSTVHKFHTMQKQGCTY
ncbi:hypothetical protein BDY19DRAFT_930906 [Irpex rosettiformis]|uniref:Uncharacterized protein n=1 Tax=Irpex rosettiformis TaxID=378272 RepID=A0ACB8UB14_9APHY|nr:hypothetical protein BDY19DRAFT_930906 [Irpex rosettiformis]